MSFRALLVTVVAAQLGLGPLAFGQPKIDNVLVKMVPPGSTSLVSARMDQIKATEFYRKLLQEQKLSQVERFAAETGFDPRRDVREMLFASTATGGVLLARGNFQIKPEPVQRAKAKLIRYGNYNIWSSSESGFCVLDKTLAAAGDLKSLEAALDEWVSGPRSGAASLLAHAKQIDAKTQFWGVSTGFATFLADNMPRTGGRAGGVGGIDFSRIFRGLEDTWFQADFRAGFKADLHGSTTSEQDAINLRDTVKGLIGFGRLSVPESQSDVLKLWDGIVVEQEGKSVTIRADIAQNLVDKLVQMLSSSPGGRGPGARGTVVPPKL